MTDDLIVQQLRDKETQLLNELNRVQLALNAFINKNMNFGKTNIQKQLETDLIPKTYEPGLTYSGKILYVLNKEGKAMLVNEIIDSLHTLEPELDLSKLHKNVSYNLSMLAKYAKIKKYPFNKHIKYSL